MYLLQTLFVVVLVLPVGVGKSDGILDPVVLHDGRMRTVSLVVQKISFVPLQNEFLHQRLKLFDGESLLHLTRERGRGEGARRRRGKKGGKRKRGEMV